MTSYINSAIANAPGFSPIPEAVRDVFTAEIYLTALPVMKFDGFTTKLGDLAYQPGRTISMPRLNGIQRGGRLMESKRMDTKPMSMSMKSVTVYEYGNAIGFTDLLLQTSYYDQLAAASLVLGRDLALVLDLALRNAFRTSTTVKYVNNKGARHLLTADDVLTPQTMDEADEVLLTNNAPKWGDYYICFIHPHHKVSMTRTTEWLNAAYYAGSDMVFSGEIGRYKGIRFISTSIMPNGGNPAVDPITGDYSDPGFDPELAAGAGVPPNQVAIYQAILFGEYAVGHAVALPVEMRFGIPGDFGREQGICWYSIWGEELLENKHVVVIESA